MLTLGQPRWGYLECFEFITWFGSHGQSAQILKAPDDHIGMRTQLCPAFCNHMDCSQPGSSVRGIF